MSHNPLLAARSLASPPLSAFALSMGLLLAAACGPGTDQAAPEARGRNAMAKIGAQRAGGCPPPAAISEEVLPAHLGRATSDLAAWQQAAAHEGGLAPNDALLAAGRRALSHLAEIYPGAADGGAPAAAAFTWSPVDPHRHLMALGMASVERARRLAAAAAPHVQAPAAQKACLGALEALAEMDEILDQALPPRPRDPYTFSQEWFATAGRHWASHTRELRGREIAILEVGSFEGASTTWMLDELLDHPRARLTAVDTFGGGMEHQEAEGDAYHLATLEQRFDENIARSVHRAKVEKMKMTSREAGLRLGSRGTMFDFIYIDGSHTAEDVLQDAVLLWPLLKEGGTMAFDDYLWRGYDEAHLCPKLAIDCFLSCLGPKVAAYEVSAYQKWVQKKISG